MTVITDIRTALAQLELVSHAPTQNLNPTARDTSDEPGGKRPSGTNKDRPPRDATHDEKIAWQTSYQAKTVDHYQHQLTQLFRNTPTNLTEQLTALHTDILETIEAWKRAPMPAGQAPLSMADPNWKRYIAESGIDTGVLARQYGCTRRYIQKIKAMNWSATKEQRAA